uniref:Uncharacterized protein n=1 Tax=Daphnia galeata TaxID=27404 RepID=A0A8J2S1P2_9CRUS|nr:unnamed protein product [Daphnia galeata]
MSGERGLGASQFGSGSSGTANNNNNNGSANNNYQQQSKQQQFTSYNHSCCSSSGYPDVGRVQVTAKILFGSVAAIQSVNAEKCRKK